MGPQYFSTSTTLRILLLTPALAFTATAQTEMMSSPTNNAYDHGMDSAFFNSMHMGMGGREMMDGPTVGPDGTAYVVRRLAPASSTAVFPQYRHELVAINPRDGSARWKLDLTAGAVSDPTLARDGKIFLTLSTFPTGVPFGGGMMNPGGSTSPIRAKLVIISADQFSARVTSTIEVESNILSSPRVAPDDTGGYTIFVTGFDNNFKWSNGHMGINWQTGEKHLYAFGSDGRLRLRLKLADARIGVPAN